MIQDEIKTLVEARVHKDGLTDTGIPGIKFFRATQAMPCAPAVYEPCVVAIASGAKEAVLDGRHYVYDNLSYLCCPMSLPVTAGTPNASPDAPLYGVFISLDQRVMSELVIEMDREASDPRHMDLGPSAQGIKLAAWDNAFSEALLRLLKICDSKIERLVLGDARLRELYYAILTGEAGAFARQAFGVGNGVARSIAHLSANLDAAPSIDDMASRAGMSRASFHRKFKQATTMSPVQFLKSMRLNNAAMQIAGGVTITEAAMDVGYVSASQFSREFKRMYGQSPRQWSASQQLPNGLS